MLESIHSDFIMDPPRMVHSVCAEFGLVYSKTRDFFFNNARITINSSVPEVIKYSGLLCNQKCVREILQGNRLCG